MNLLKLVFNREWKIKLTLIGCSFAIYFWHFHPIFLNLNSILSSITLDSIKNYYTFLYHAKNDSSILQFSGMNYPLGEHVVYTDCQPLLSGLLSLFPFTHNYLIGILHALLYLSFIISPVILFRIFLILKLDRISAFMFALGIALLSPQFLKINAGHFALAYGCLIPYSILLILKTIDNRKLSLLLWIFGFNFLLFFIHPYLGFSLSIFTLMSLFFFDISGKKTRLSFQQHLGSIITGLLPILFFKLFMAITDTHANRTDEPYGSEVMVENIDSMLAPEFGPFKNFLGAIFQNPSQHFEGHSYLGFFTLFFTLVFIVAIPFLIKKRGFIKSMNPIFVSSLIILLISFGLHTMALDLLGVKIAAVNQFRAVCRFAWIFYFAFTIFIISTLYHFGKNTMSHSNFRALSLSIGLLFFTFNYIEAHGMFKMHETAYWKFRNFFNPILLNNEEQRVLKKIKSISTQAIVPLPIFHGGSEMYERNGSSNSMVPSMVYSYHSGLPILSMMSSRTSITETENLIQVLNSYKKNKLLASYFSEKEFLVIKTAEDLLPDEERLLPETRFFEVSDSLSIGFLSKNNLLKRKLVSPIIFLKSDSVYRLDSLGLIYLPFEKRKPFLNSQMKDFEKMFELRENEIPSGNYILSLRFYYSERKYQSLAISVIVTEAHDTIYAWRDLLPLRKLSGFYDAYGMFEHEVLINKNQRYEFVLNGSEPLSYQVSHVMLRPKSLNVVATKKAQDTLFNNFEP